MRARQAWRCLSRVAAAAAAAGDQAVPALSRSLYCIPSLLMEQPGMPWQSQLQCSHSSSAKGFAWWAASSSRRSIHTSPGAQAQDYYEVLGLSRKATDQEIKKAYYKLAKKYHPDTNKEDPEAAKQFQEVSKAYETLRDPEKRQYYDQVGREGMENMEKEGGFPGGGFAGDFSAGGGAPFDHEELLRMFFAGGGMHGFGGGAGGFGGGMMFVESSLRLTFMEAVKGTKRRIDMTPILGKPMPPVEVEIPPGVDSGQQIQVAAPAAVDGKQRVNVLFSIQVDPHPEFRRNGQDIIYPATLKLSEALVGKTLTVPTIDGKSEVTVPPCTMNGDVLVMRGKGVATPRSRNRGDQLVTIRVLKPHKITGRQMELLREFAAEDVSSSGSSSSSSSKEKKGGWFS